MVDAVPPIESAASEAVMVRCFEAFIRWGRAINEAAKLPEGHAAEQVAAERGKEVARLACVVAELVGDMELPA